MKKKLLTLTTQVNSELLRTKNETFGGNLNKEKMNQRMASPAKSIRSSIRKNSPDSSKKNNSNVLIQ